MVNLLPVWPLDGGHISRALLKQWDPDDGVRKSLILSAVIAAIVGIAALGDQNTWVAIMFGIFAVSSLQSMEGERRRPIQPYRRWRD
jgi:Zn-dependent protease